jgi:hypothetical protein
MPEDLPDRMPDRMSEDMPEDMPDKMPEDMSDRMPEDLPLTKRIDVMVGISRSKYTIYIIIYPILYPYETPITTDSRDVGRRNTPLRWRTTWAPRSGEAGWAGGFQCAP